MNENLNDPLDLLNISLTEEQDEPIFIDLMEVDQPKPYQVGEEPLEIAILPLRNTVLFPGVVVPINATRDRSIQLIREVTNSKSKLIGVVSQIDSANENPQPEDLYTTGTISQILRMMRMPDGSVTVVLQGRYRFQVNDYTQKDPYFKAHITPNPDIDLTDDNAKALALALKNEASKLVEMAPHIPTEQSIALMNMNQLLSITYFVASNLNMVVQVKQAVLEMDDLLSKADSVFNFLTEELKVWELREEIQSKVKVDLDKQQRDYILRQQIKTIQDELGDQSFDTDIDSFKARGTKKIWSPTIQEIFNKEIQKLYRLQNGSPEYGITVTYIEWLLDLPWESYTKDRIDLKLSRKYLDEDHYGMDKVKERILEYLAVLKLKGDMKAPILCFYGPPGVGKTSLAKSIGRAVKRHVIRVSLGGVRDEAEIRGHRRTYIGAQPGRIIQNLKKAKTGNPIFILDEIDKVGNDWRGDPSSALLEVLDPEQNNAFNDHYLEVDYDLSPIMFIATANSLDTIHPALRDRMEIVEINGYTMQEKLQIAIRHLVPKQRADHGLKENQFTINDEALQYVIERYTRESGVRKLTQQIATLCRCVAREVVENKIKSLELTVEHVEKFLGTPRYENEYYQKHGEPGVAVGLAWTQVGGDILFIEAVLSRGTGKLSLTGQLGQVMQESAKVAHIYLHANAEAYGIPIEAFSKWDVHIHIPAGGIPKDGPSAGVTMLTALASLFTQRLVKSNLAMTGEITLRGKTLPVGGIKEKVLAAARSGITTIVMCGQNVKDVQEIPEELTSHIQFVYCDSMKDVLANTLEKKPLRSNDFLIVTDKEKKDEKESEKKRIKKAKSNQISTIIHP